jgi:acyl carrier protein
LSETTISNPIIHLTLKAADPMSTEATIRNYILENYLFTNDQSSLDSGDSFLDKGVLDSTGILEVIYFLEETFGIKVSDEEMIPENLDSVNNIVAFIERKA